MRVRALDIRSASIGGLPVPVRACTLAVRTGDDGRRAWDAVGWTPGPDPGLHARVDGAGPLPVALETDEGSLAGSALVSIAAAGGTPAAGGRLSLTGVGGLEPWPGC